MAPRKSRSHSCFSLRTFLLINSIFLATGWVVFLFNFMKNESFSVKDVEKTRKIEKKNLKIREVADEQGQEKHLFVGDEDSIDTEQVDDYSSSLPISLILDASESEEGSAIEAEETEDINEGKTDEQKLDKGESAQLPGEEEMGRGLGEEMWKELVEVEKDTFLKFQKEASFESFKKSKEFEKCSLFQGSLRVDKYRRQMEHPTVLCATKKYRNEFADVFEHGKDDFSGDLSCYVKWKGKQSHQYLCRGRNWATTTKNVMRDSRLKFKASCEWTPQAKEKLPLQFKINEDKSNKELNEFSPAAGISEECNFVETQPTVIFRPRESMGRNPWHSHEELLTLFMTMAALRLESPKILINRVHPNPKGLFPVYDMYRALFSSDGTIWHADSFSDYETMCFSEIVIPIPPEQALHTKKPLAGCGPSPLLKAYSSLVINTFQLDKGHVDTVGSIFHVLLISRQGSFKRRIENEDELTAALNANAQYDVQKAVLEKLTLKDQLSRVRHANCLIGAHGAALFWLTLMQSCSQVLEFGTGGDPHYRDLSIYTGIHHKFVGPGSGHGAASISIQPSLLITEVAQARLRFSKCRLTMNQ